jgi:hypothetical protein
MRKRKIVDDVKAIKGKKLRPSKSTDVHITLGLAPPTNRWFFCINAVFSKTFLGDLAAPGVWRHPVDSSLTVSSPVSL